MEPLLDYGLRLHTNPEYKSLYSWAVIETDAQGKKIGDDQIPWQWSLYFTATSCMLQDSIELKERDDKESKSEQKRSISVWLQPGRRIRGGEFQREAAFSMFGTKRKIKDISLTIYPVTDANEEERCNVWGCVSYTTEIDYRNETMPDCICFYLFVKQETFDRYAAKVALNSVDEMVLQVKAVQGFYSEWSPGISTSRVKVLAGDDDQKITLPEGTQFAPPRLGQVGEATLYINRKLEFGRDHESPEPEPETFDLARDEVRAPTAPAAQPVLFEANALPALKSLKRAAWGMVILLVLILFALTSRY